MTKIGSVRVEQSTYTSEVQVGKTDGNKEASVWEKYNNTQENTKKIVTENYEYTSPEGNTYKGKLTIFNDGTCFFEATSKNGTPFLLEFKSESAFKKNKIHKQINNPNDDNKRTTLSYHYDILGHKSSIEITNAEDKLLKVIKYNNSGKVTKEERYDTETGKVKQTIKHEYDKKTHIETREVYDENKNLESTVLVQYAEDNKTVLSVTVKDKDGNIKSETTYKDGNIIQSITYKDNKKIVQDYSDENYIKTEEYTGDELTSKATLWKDTKVVKDKWELNDGQMVHTISSEVDLDFKPSRQIGQGDCYLISVINSMIGADGGCDALKELIDVKDEGGHKNYTVTLPGALLLKEGLKDDNRIDPNKSYVTGTYTFTQEEFDAILKQAGKKYSIGNANVILLEAAFEKFREEVLKTMKANNITKIDKQTAGMNVNLNEDNILYNGLTYDATYMLTGQKSHVYMKQKDYALSSEDLHNGKFTIVEKPKPAAILQKAAPSEVVDNVATTDDELKRFIEQTREDFKDGRVDHIIAVGFGTINNNGEKGGHAFTVVGITDTEIKLINPWHPEDIVTMSLEDFNRVVSQFSISEKPAKKSISPQDLLENYVPERIDGTGNTEGIDEDENDNNAEGSNKEYNIVTNDNVTSYFAKTNNSKPFAKKNADGSFKTMALEGESFKATMTRLGITKENLGNNFDRAEKLFNDANITSALRRGGGWFIVGKLDITIPKELAELIDFEENIKNCVMDPNAEEDKWKKKLRLA